MNPLATWLLLNTTNFFTDSKIKIQGIIDEYLQDATSTAVLVDDKVIWEDIRLQMVMIRLQLQDYSPHHPPVEAYIIDLRKSHWNTTTLDSVRRNGRTKFIIFVSEDTKNQIVDSARELEICRVIIVLVKDASVTSESLFVRCKGIGFHLKPKSLVGCSTNASFLEHPPRAFIENGEIAGVEGLLAEHTARYYGLSLSYINRHETGWSEVETDINSSVSVLGFTGFFPLVRRHEKFDMFESCVGSSLAWSVPVGAGYSLPSWCVVLITELTPSVWLATLAVYVTVAAVSYVTSEIKDEVPLQVLSLIIGNSHNQPRKMPKRLAGGVLLFGILICTTYTSTMSSKLTSPVRVANIDSMKGLAESRLEPQGPYLPHTVLKQSVSPDRPELAKIVARFDSTTANVKAIFERMVTKRDNAYLRHDDNMFYLAQKNPKTANKIHIMKEVLMPYRVAVLTKKHSCFFEDFKSLYGRLCEAGFAVKWTRDFTPHKVEAEGSSEKPIDLAHLLGAFYLIIAGWSAALVAFVAEIICLCISRMKTPSLKMIFL